MARTAPYPDADEDIGAQPAGAAPGGTSPWQKAVGVLGLLVVLWVGGEMYDVVFFDGVGPGSGGTDAPAGTEGPEDGGGHTPGPPAGGH